MCYAAPVLKLLTAPVTNDRSPRYMERALAAIHQALPPGEGIELIYATAGGRIGLYLQFPDPLEELVCGPVIANYPQCLLTTVEKWDEKLDAHRSYSTGLMLQPELFPILRHAQFEDLLNGKFADPITGVLRSIRADDGLSCRIAIHVRPATARRRRRAMKAVRLLDREFFRRHPRLAEYYAEHVTRPSGWFPAWLLGWCAWMSPQLLHTPLETSTSRLHDREERLQSAAEKLGGHLFETQLRLTVTTPPARKRLAQDRLRQMAGAFGAFTKSSLATFHRKARGGFPAESTFLTSHEELATLFHPPTATVSAEGLQTTEFTELEPPAQFCSGEEPGAVTIGQVRYRDDRRLIGLGAEDRLRHMYVIGSTGCGKSTLLLNLIRQDIAAGRGLSVIDVHGDLADAAVRLVPPGRARDLVQFDATAERTVSFNPLACTDPARVDQVASGVVSAFKKLFDSWGPRLENLLRYAAFTIVEQQGTLLDMLRLLTDKAYRDQTVLRIQDDVVRAFWQNEFATWTAQYRTEAVSSVTNKLMPFVTNRQLREITCTSSRRGLDLRRIMDERGILITNLSRGKLGQDNATLLGSLLLTSIEQAALTRAELPEQQRVDHFVYLDEFQSLVTPSTGIMLSESRKYRVGLILSHQFTQQLDPDTLHAVLGNCGTLAAFRVGLEDAELLAPAFSKYPDQLRPSDLSNLPNYTMYLRPLVGGTPANPCSAATLR